MDGWGGSCGDGGKEREGKGREGKGRITAYIPAITSFLYSNPGLSRSMSAGFIMNAALLDTLTILTRFLSACAAAVAFRRGSRSVVRWKGARWLVWNCVSKPSGVSVGGCHYL